MRARQSAKHVAASSWSSQTRGSFDRTMVFEAFLIGFVGRATLFEASHWLSEWLGWWLLVRRGCRIPAFDLFTVPMRRAVDTISRRFIEEGAPQVARHLGKSPASLIMAGKVCISELVLDSQTSDLVIKRRWNEAEVPWRLRFERTLVEHTTELYRVHIHAHLGRQLEAIAQAWATHGE